MKDLMKIVKERFVSTHSVTFVFRILKAGQQDSQRIPKCCQALFKE